jgi:hypothetical protein
LPVSTSAQWAAYRFGRASLAGWAGFSAQGDSIPHDCFLIFFKKIDFSFSVLKLEIDLACNKIA